MSSMRRPFTSASPSSAAGGDKGKKKDGSLEDSARRDIVARFITPPPSLESSRTDGLDFTSHSINEQYRAGVFGAVAEFSTSQKSKSGEVPTVVRLDATHTSSLDDSRSGPFDADRSRQSNNTTTTTTNNNTRTTRTSALSSTRMSTSINSSIDDGVSSASGSGTVPTTGRLSARSSPHGNNRGSGRNLPQNEASHESLMSSTGSRGNRKRRSGGDDGGKAHGLSPRASMGISAALLATAAVSNANYFDDGEESDYSDEPPFAAAAQRKSKTARSGGKRASSRASRGSRVAASTSDGAGKGGSRTRGRNSAGAHSPSTRHNNSANKLNSSNTLNSSVNSNNLSTSNRSNSARGGRGGRGVKGGSGFSSSGDAGSFNAANVDVFDLLDRLGSDDDDTDSGDTGVGGGQRRGRDRYTTSGNNNNNNNGFNLNTSLTVRGSRRSPGSRSGSPSGDGSASLERSGVQARRASSPGNAYCVTTPNTPTDGHLLSQSLDSQQHQQRQQRSLTARSGKGGRSTSPSPLSLSQGDVALRTSSERCSLTSGTLTSSRTTTAAGSSGEHLQTLSENVVVPRFALSLDSTNDYSNANANAHSTNCPTAGSSGVSIGSTTRRIDSPNLRVNFSDSSINFDSSFSSASRTIFNRSSYLDYKENSSRHNVARPARAAVVVDPEAGTVRVGPALGDEEGEEMPMLAEPRTLLPRGLELLFGLAGVASPSNRTSIYGVVGCPSMTLAASLFCAGCATLVAYGHKYYGAFEDKENYLTWLLICILAVFIPICCSLYLHSWVRSGSLEILIENCKELSPSAHRRVLSSRVLSFYPVLVTVLAVVVFTGVLMHYFFVACGVTPTERLTFYVVLMTMSFISITGWFLLFLAALGAFWLTSRIFVTLTEDYRNIVRLFIEPRYEEMGFHSTNVVGFSRTVQSRVEKYCVPHSRHINPHTMGAGERGVLSPRSSQPTSARGSGRKPQLAGEQNYRRPHLARQATQISQCMTGEGIYENDKLARRALLLRLEHQLDLLEAASERMMPYVSALVACSSVWILCCAFSVMMDYRIVVAYFAMGHQVTFCTFLVISASLPSMCMNKLMFEVGRFHTVCPQICDERLYRHLMSQKGAGLKLFGVTVDSKFLLRAFSLGLTVSIAILREVYGASQLSSAG